ncbi:MAG: ABC transporter ATP-binding protein [Candidatus Izemoplasmatales bacterium]
MDAIKITNLKKYYGKSRGLESATFSVREGEIFGFVGPNGAGKTTLIRILLGLIHPTLGEVSIFNQLPGKDSPQLNKEIGYLPSEAFFFPEMKVKDVLKFYGAMRKISSEREMELIERFDLDLSKKVSELSFGNKKKLGIVVALMHQPKLLILDEPTTGLDPLMQQTFLELLLEEKKKGVTIFLSSHILSEVEKICDRVALIREGEIKAVFEMKDVSDKITKKVILSPIITKKLIAGLTLAEVKEETGFYDYQGDINKLLTYLSGFSFTSVQIKDASLEEIFIGYYQKEGQDNVL